MRIRKILSSLPKKYWIKSLCYIYGVPLLRKLFHKILTSILILTRLMSFTVGISFLSLFGILFRILFDLSSEKVIRENLMKVMKGRITEKEIQTFILKHRRHFLKTLIEARMLMEIKIKDRCPLKELTVIEGRKNLNKALGIGKGIVLLSAHIGAYHLLPYMLT